jgi:hypothetical protein
MIIATAVCQTTKHQQHHHYHQSSHHHCTTHLVITSSIRKTAVFLIGRLRSKFAIQGYFRRWLVSDPICD